MASSLVSLVRGALVVRSKLQFACTRLCHVRGCSGTMGESVTESSPGRTGDIGLHWPVTVVMWAVQPATRGSGVERM